MSLEGKMEDGKFDSFPFSLLHLTFAISYGFYAGASASMFKLPVADQCASILPGENLHTQCCFLS